MRSIYGIVGYPLGHTRSPQYFNEKFQQEGIDAEYLKFEMEDIRELEHILELYPELRGFNVTIPHKQNIIPLLNQISDEAKEIGAVNCVKITIQSGKPYLSGYNTDVYGFRKALLPFIPNNIRKALILGNGGAAKAIRYVLHSLNMETLTVSRIPRSISEISYPEAEKHIADARLIVNTTPLGTWPETESHPVIPYEKLTPEHYLFDLVYNPGMTEFMKRGAAAGAHSCNGYAMWLGQAEKNREIWED